MNSYLLRILPLLLLAAALVTWAASGANLGWTRTSVPVKQLDEVTGIEGISYRSQLVPGLDFLAAAGVLAGGLMLISLLWRRRLPRSDRRSAGELKPNL
jgi:hypothetical protein